MKHEKYKELLNLNVLGELSAEEEIELQNHIFECDECRAEYSKLKKFYSVITTNKNEEINDNDLINARVRLFNTINSSDQKSNSKWDLFLEKFRRFTTNNYTIAFGSVALVLIGLLVGYLVFYNIPNPQLVAENIIDLDKIEQGEVEIANIKLPDKFSDNDQFEFQFLGKELLNYKGDINDILVQKLLAEAIKETDNPGFKIKTVNSIGKSISKTFVPDEAIKVAFIQTLKKDNNPGVRKEALRALVNFPYDNQIRDALLFTLENDENASNRMDAINALLSLKYESQPLNIDLRNKLENNIVNEENEVIKFKTAKYISGGK